VLGLLPARRFPLCPALGLLRARRLALRAGLRIAPYSDTLRWIDIVPSCRPPHFAGAPITDYSALDTWLSQLPANCSALRFVCPAPDTDLTRRLLLDARCCLQIAPLAALCARAGHGSLRVADRSAIST